MVRAYHAVFSTYGFWLPNDPRGSGSRYVGSDALRPYGRATFVADRRRSRAASPHDFAVRRLAKQALKYPEVLFTDEQRESVGAGFGKYVRRSKVTVWACSIMPAHVHTVIAKHRLDIEQLENLLKGAATRRLRKDGRHPMAKYEDEKGSVPTC